MFAHSIRTQLSKLQLLFFILTFALFLSGCASSNVSREAESSIDMGVQNAKNLVSGDSDIADSYQNSSQTAKGALLGGGVGALTGSLYSGIGVIPGTAIGAILGASYGRYIDDNTTLEDRLINRGAAIVVLGDQILVVIPSARIFDTYTSHIKPQAYSTIKMLGNFINQYTKMLVKIGVYTNDSGSPTEDLALSQQQAQHFEKLLAAYQVNARVLYAAGYGSSRPVVKPCADWDSDNYRIEITMEKLYV